jgi:hypothetical protein
MYALAQDIKDECDEPHLRHMALRVTEILHHIIDKPVASSKQLQEARRRFTILQNCLGSRREFATPSHA